MFDANVRKYMYEKAGSIPLAVLLACVTALHPAAACAAPVTVRHVEGLVHGFLLLSSVDGDPLAHGDLIQVSRGSQVTNHLTFRFKDGSVHDETTVFSQRGTFRLISYHLVQKGPIFPRQLEVTIDSLAGRITVHSADDGKDKDKDDKDKVTTDQRQLPPDIANGMIFTLLKNVLPDGPPTTVSMIAAIPKPRLVKVKIGSQGEEPFSVGGSERKATHYVLKIEIGGVAGAIAPIVGKQPPDIHIWVLQGEAPAFVKSEGPLYAEGPIWRIELTSPVWPRSASEDSGSPK
jgi:hypothetical protein